MSLELLPDCLLQRILHYISTSELWYNVRKVNRRFQHLSLLCIRKHCNVTVSLEDDFGGARIILEDIQEPSCKVIILGNLLQVNRYLSKAERMTIGKYFCLRSTSQQSNLLRSLCSIRADHVMIDVPLVDITFSDVLALFELPVISLCLQNVQGLLDFTLVAKTLRAVDILKFNWEEANLRSVALCTHLHFMELNCYGELSPRELSQQDFTYLRPLSQLRTFILRGEFLVRRDATDVFQGMSNFWRNLRCVELRLKKCEKSDETNPIIRSLMSEFRQQLRAFATGGSREVMSALVATCMTASIHVTHLKCFTFFGHLKPQYFYDYSPPGCLSHVSGQLDDEKEFHNLPLAWKNIQFRQFLTEIICEEWHDI